MSSGDKITGIANSSSGLLPIFKINETATFESHVTKS